MLTEILLEVTTSEMEAVAKEVYYKEKNRAAKGSTYFKSWLYFQAGPQHHTVTVPCSLCNGG